MEILKNLLTRFGLTGTLVIAGFIVIIYIAFGFLYLQQGAQQREFEEQITKLTPVVSRPLPSAEQLQTEYKAINDALAPMTDQDTVGTIVAIAEKSGIDIDPGADKFHVPSAKPSQASSSLASLPSDKPVPIKIIKLQI